MHRKNQQSNKSAETKSFELCFGLLCAYICHLEEQSWLSSSERIPGGKKMLKFTIAGGGRGVVNK